MGGLNVSFSKDLFPDLYVGVGLGFEFGNDWGLGLDLGFLSLVGDLGFLKDFRWGVALRNIGKAYADPARRPRASTSGSPPSFTPALGASFARGEDGQARRSSFSPDVSFPTFQDVRFGLGMQFAVADIFFLNAAYAFDLREALGSTEPAAVHIPFGVRHLPEAQRPRREDGGPGRDGVQYDRRRRARWQNGVWGFGAGVNVPLGVRDVTPPVITIDTEGEKYISPNFDGVKDDLVLPLSITDNRYVKGYKFIITDSSGAAVRTIQNKEDRPENTGRQEHPRAARVREDGDRHSAHASAGTGCRTRAPSSRTAPTRYHVEAWDDNNNLGKSPDGHGGRESRRRPRSPLSAPYLIFSPDGDGNKDTLPLQQTGSTEDPWTGTIQDIAGQVGPHLHVEERRAAERSNGTARRTRECWPRTACTATTSRPPTGRATAARRSWTTSSSIPAPRRSSSPSTCPTSPRTGTG